MSSILLTRDQAVFFGRKGEEEKGNEKKTRDTFKLNGLLKRKGEGLITGCDLSVHTADLQPSTNLNAFFDGEKNDERFIPWMLGENACCDVFFRIKREGKQIFSSVSSDNQLCSTLSLSTQRYKCVPAAVRET